MPETITRRTYTKVAFGDVVQLSKERSKDPEAGGLERYVGLEHLEPGDLKIRGWGDSADGTTFTNVFRPGQVLFGKRRAYQRKVAVADFSGVCSGDIYVLEPKGNDLLPELLPFICQTDAFFDHAVGTSAGSLSPRTNWKSLATFEFALPPLEEQRRIAEVLLAAEQLRATRLDAFDKAETLLGSLLTSMVLGKGTSGPRRSTPLGSIPKHWGIRTLGEVASFTNGVAKPASEFGSGAPFVNLLDVFGQVLLEVVPEDRVRVSSKELESLSLARNDILFVRSSVKPEGVAKTVLIDADWEGVVFSGFLIRCRISDSTLDPRFANLLFREQHFRRLALSRSTVSLNTNINQGQLGVLPVVVPPLEEQDQTVSDIYSALRGSNELGLRLKQDGELSQELLHHGFDRVEDSK